MLWIFFFVLDGFFHKRLHLQLTESQVTPSHATVDEARATSKRGTQLVQVELT